MSPTVTEEYLKEIVQGEQYFTTGKTTICVLTLKNDFEVVGTSAPVSRENFDKEIGEKYAYEKAFQKLWELEGYLLQERLYWKSKEEE